MATDTGKPTAAPWPAEGLSLLDTMARVAPKAWHRYEAAKKAAASVPRHRRLAGGGATDYERTLIWTCDDAFKICLAILVAMWDRGELTAKGRRGDPLSAPIDIAPPKRGWRVLVVNATKSTIHDPDSNRRNGRIHDLRFLPTAPMATEIPAKTEPKPKQTRKRKSKKWEEIKPKLNTKFSGKDGTKRLKAMVEAKQWAEIAREIGIPGSEISTMVRGLKDK
jgi:hypothetical protein